MNLTLDGRVALVTGANGGLGAHFAETLAKAGAKVALCARRVDTLADVAARIRDRGGAAHQVALDVTRRDSVVSAFEDAARRLGPVTVVVNNAGIAVTKPLLDHTDDDWEQVVGVNLTGAWRVAQEAARHMVEERDRRQHRQHRFDPRLARLVAGAELRRVEGGAHPPHQGDGARARPAQDPRQRTGARLRRNGHQPRILRKRSGTGARSSASRSGASAAPASSTARCFCSRSDAGSYATGSVFVVDGGQLVNAL